MRLRRAHERDACGVDVEVVDIVIRPGQQPGVFPSLYGVAQDRTRCGHLLPP